MNLNDINKIVNNCDLSNVNNITDWFFKLKSVYFNDTELNLRCIKIYFTCKGTDYISNLINNNILCQLSYFITDDTYEISYANVTIPNYKYYTNNCIYSKSENIQDEIIKILQNIDIKHIIVYTSNINDELINNKWDKHNNELTKHIYNKYQLMVEQYDNEIKNVFLPKLHKFNDYDLSNDLDYYYDEKYNIYNEFIETIKFTYSQYDYESFSEELDKVAEQYITKLHLNQY